MEFSVPMALVDFIPVILYAIAAVILQRDLYGRMSKGAFALFAAGTIDVIAASALKALYKLLYALNVCDFQALNSMFFPVQSIGFLLAGLGVVAMLTHKQSERLSAVAAPAVFSGTFVFVALMILGLGAMDGGLIVLAKKLKKPGAIVLLVLSFIFCLGMGYLSSKDFGKSSMNWIAEGINAVGQLAFLAGCGILHEAGLDKL